MKMVMLAMFSDQLKIVVQRPKTSVEQTKRLKNKKVADLVMLVKNANFAILDSTLRRVKMVSFPKTQVKEFFAKVSNFFPFISCQPEIIPML